MIITPALSHQWTTVGYLYTSPNPAGLGEDMFEASLDDGTTIEAGWTREGDPSGRYEVRVMRGFNDVMPPFFTTDIGEAAAAILAAAEQVLAIEAAAAVFRLRPVPRRG